MGINEVALCAAAASADTCTGVVERGEARQGCGGGWQAWQDPMSTMTVWLEANTAIREATWEADTALSDPSC